MNVRGRNGAILRQLQTLYNIGSIRELSDGQLLERFATDRDEVAALAFAALVERHESLVWRVCLAVLHDEHDAEDRVPGDLPCIGSQGASHSGCRTRSGPGFTKSPAARRRACGRRSFGDESMSSGVR